MKWLGDGVMFYFPDPGVGVVAALTMVEAVNRESLPPAHVGLHAGPVVFQEGDFHGQTVNIRRESVTTRAPAKSSSARK